VVTNPVVQLFLMNYVKSQQSTIAHWQYPHPFMIVSPPRRIISNQLYLPMVNKD